MSAEAAARRPAFVGELLLLLLLLLLLMLLMPPSAAQLFATWRLVDWFPAGSTALPHSDSPSMASGTIVPIASAFGEAGRSLPAVAAAESARTAAADP